MHAWHLLVTEQGECHEITEVRVMAIYVSPSIPLVLRYHIVSSSIIYYVASFIIGVSGLYFSRRCVIWTMGGYNDKDINSTWTNNSML